ncbi:septin-interacting protein 1 isoform X2 [Eupeodes corollae]|uniref:septin-interacting protein 1 isoform X2 n=1 Tax=Eupeodes corollae TaxID=290404 RepID=UPI00249155AA|nr:septin-interacting protein 1 isoform X2 [Eupeodes corollae]
MSDNEYEAFEITDYDLANEFNPNRPRRKLTKNQQIYGIWADSDSDADSDVEMSARRRRRGASKSRSSGPVNFVTGGIQQSGSLKKDKLSQDDDNQITDEEEDSSHRRAVQGNDAPDKSSNSSSEEEAGSSTRMGFGMKPRQPAPSSKPVGAWEQHTKGIGAKLLLQMGYKPGMGLGKDLQGIAQPVQATLRKGRGAIGAYGPETPQTIGDPGLSKQIDNENSKEYNKDKLNKWKKGDSKKDTRKNQYNYRSVEEVIEKAKKHPCGILPDKLSKKLGNVPVIDMTGPEKRVLSGYHAIGQTKVIDEDLYDPQSQKKPTGFELPELTHNLNLIVNQCEQEIISLDIQGREARERYKALEHEKKNLEKVVQMEEDHIDTLEKALALVEELSSDSGDLTLARAEKIFIELQRDFPAEYKEFALGDLAAGVIAPLVNIELKSWNPLEEPLRYIDTVKKWKTILDMHPSGQRNNVFDPYSSLVWAGVIPSFRASVANWNPKMHQRMAALLDSWAPLFPTWVLDNVLEQLILPQLVAGVNEWDPLTDTIPIHIWIIPWNTILGHKMEEHIFPTIREKLGFALQAWTPQDRSARAMITPWKGAFDEGEMQAFMLKHIIPKLQMSLNDLIINPLQQDLELWNQVWEWKELIPPLLMGQMLDKFFFPKWMQVLVLWLNQSPDFDQISRWYTGWKSVFGEEIVKLPMIKEHLRRALEMMHRATETIAPPQPVPTPVGPPHHSTSSSSASTSSAANLNPPALMDLQIAPPVQLEFKELVSQKCAERGIIFAPMPGRREFGKQVYRVGKLFCYIDRNVVMLSDGSLKNWTPTSLGLTIERAVSG